MDDRTAPRPFGTLVERLRSGEIDRRQFLQTAAALGMSAALANQIAGSSVAAQESSPAPSGTGRPAVNTENQARGEGGDLRIIQWQAPSHLSALQATGDKDGLGASLVSEALMVRGPQGQLIPNLITKVPTVENGLLAQDYTSVTFNLLPGVLWSDGEPFTAADVAFTLDWILDKTFETATDENGTPIAATTNGAVTRAIYETIDSYTTAGDLSITITFTQPNPTWSDGYTGAGRSVIYPRHVLDGGGQEAMDAFRVNPIGTGPYKVDEFIANDRVIYSVNENYREPNKPYFGRVILEGGGDAGPAARAVIQSGDYDFGWNIAIEPELATSLTDEDAPGLLLVAPDIQIERININFSDPRAEVDGQRSEMHTPHPILSELAVRQAMNLAIDRQLIANSFFFGGQEEPAVVNILSGIPRLASRQNRLVFDQDRARQLLDQAGWVLDGEVRKKDGMELALNFQTTINQVRQKIQQVVKANLEEIGFRIELVQTDASIFFGRAEGNAQSNARFQYDLNMFQSSVGAPPPVAYMLRWYAGEDGENIAQASNNWTGPNIQRYSNAEYDELFRQAQVESDPDEQDKLLIAMNDMLFDDAAVLPLVRVKNKLAVGRTLNQVNLAPSPYEYDYWNIANWNRVAE